LEASGRWSVWLTGERWLVKHIEGVAMTITLTTGAEKKRA